MNHSKTTSPVFKRLLVLCIWLFFAYVFFRYCIITPLQTPGVDFPKHHQAAEVILQGGNPYIGDLYLGFNYPLFTGWVYLWLAAFDIDTAEIIWDLLNAFYILLSMIITALWLKPRPPDRWHAHAEVAAVQQAIQNHWPTVAALGLALYTPAYLTMFDGNIEPLNIVLIIAFVAALNQKEEHLAGVLIVFLSLIKILPGLFLFTLFACRRKRAYLVAVSCFSLYGLVLLASGFWRHEMVLYTDTLHNIGYYWRGISHSLTAIIVEHAAPYLSRDKHGYDLLGKSIALFFAGSHLTVLTFYRLKACRAWREIFAHASLSIVLISPLLEDNHLIFGMPTFWFLLTGFSNSSVSLRRFLVSMFLWICVFSARTLHFVLARSDLPLQFATILFLVLWLISTVHLIKIIKSSESDLKK